MSERPSDHDLEVLRAAVQSYDLPENTVAGLLMALDELREWRASEIDTDMPLNYQPISRIPITMRLIYRGRLAPNLIDATGDEDE
jgi:hypothetical protein